MPLPKREVRNPINYNLARKNHQQWWLSHEKKYHPNGNDQLLIDRHWNQLVKKNYRYLKFFEQMRNHSSVS